MVLPALRLMGECTKRNVWQAVHPRWVSARYPLGLLLVGSMRSSGWLYWTVMLTAQWLEHCRIVCWSFEAWHGSTSPRNALQLLVCEHVRSALYAAIGKCTVGWLANQ